MHKQCTNEFYRSQQQFNPIETFGNRQNTPSHLYTQQKTNDQIHYLQLQNVEQEPVKKAKQQRGDIRNNRMLYDKKTGQDNRDGKQQTRIKLLSSFQESYLESISHPNFTEPDQISEIKIQFNKDNFLYSDAKQTKFYQKKLMNSVEHAFQNSKVMKNSFKDYEIQNKGNHEFKNQPLKGYVNRRGSSKYSNEAQLSKQIEILQLQIDEQEYNLRIQDKLYDFLLIKINERGKAKKTKDIHQIIQRAVEFMDSGQQFIKQLSRLNSYIKN